MLELSIFSCITFLTIFFRHFYKSKYNQIYKLIKLLLFAYSINFIERIVTGSVSDYISITIGKKVKIFNIVDACQMILIIFITFYTSKLIKPLLFAKDRRNQMLVDKKTQLNFVLFQSLFAILNVLFAISLTLAIIEGQLILGTLIATFLILINIIYLFKISNLISGPIFSYHRYIKENGSTKGFTTRDGDFHKFLDDS